jgi:hypothetical protein
VYKPAALPTSSSEGFSHAAKLDDNSSHYHFSGGCWLSRHETKAKLGTPSLSSPDKSFVFLKSKAPPLATIAGSFSLVRRIAERLSTVIGIDNNVCYGGSLKFA